MVVTQYWQSSQKNRITRSIAERQSCLQSGAQGGQTDFQRLMVVGHILQQQEIVESPEKCALEKIGVSFPARDVQLRDVACRQLEGVALMAGW